MDQTGTVCVELWVQLCIQHSTEIAEIEFIQLKQNLVLALCMVSYLFNNSIAFQLTAGLHFLLHVLHNADKFKVIFSHNQVRFQNMNLSYHMMWRIYEL